MLFDILADETLEDVCNADQYLLGTTDRSETVLLSVALSSFRNGFCSRFSELKARQRFCCKWYGLLFFSF